MTGNHLQIRFDSGDPPQKLGVKAVTKYYSKAAGSLSCEILRSTDVNKLQEAKRTGKPLLGMFSYEGNPDLTEMLGYAGIEFLFIDNEHTANDWKTLANVMRSCELSGIFPMLRVKKEYPGYPSNVRMALEIGAGMVFVPHVNTKEEALAVVRAAKFSPKYKSGTAPADQARGVDGQTRAGKFVTETAEYCKSEDEKRMVSVSLEEPRALKNLDEILTVEGIDHIDLGTGDLSVAFGYPGLIGKASGVAELVGENKEKVPGAAELVEKYNAAMKKYPDKFINQRNIDWLEVLTNYEKAKSKIEQGIKEGAYLFNLPNEWEILRYVVRQCKKALDEAYENTKKK